MIINSIDMDRSYGLYMIRLKNETAGRKHVGTVDAIVYLTDDDLYSK